MLRKKKLLLSKCTVLITTGISATGFRNNQGRIYEIPSGPESNSCVISSFLFLQIKTWCAEQGEIFFAIAYTLLDCDIYYFLFVLQAPVSLKVQHKIVLHL